MQNSYLLCAVTIYSSIFSSIIIYLTHLRLTFTRSVEAYSSSLNGLREVTRGENQADDTVIASEFVCVCAEGGGRGGGCVRVSMCVTTAFPRTLATSFSWCTSEIIKQPVSAELGSGDADSRDAVTSQGGLLCTVN